MDKLLEKLNLLELSDTQKDKFLTFLIGEECYGIDIKYVIEIIGIQKITQIPELPNYVKGIINLRGKIVPVVDVRLKFGKQFMDYNDKTCIIVIELYEKLIGLVVDTISEVISIPEENIEPPFKIKSIFVNDKIKGIGKVEDDIKIIIDCQKLFSSCELMELEDIN